jgi:hypothetical protein
MIFQQFKFNPDSNEFEITFRIPLQPFINLFADKIQPVIIEPKVDLTLTSREPRIYELAMRHYGGGSREEK